MNVQQQAAALSHEYWRFVDRRANNFGENHEITYFYGVFSPTDGSLIVQLILLDKLDATDDMRAIGCPQLGLPTSPINPMGITVDTFGGKNMGKSIFVVHISAFAERRIHPYTPYMEDIYAIKTNASVFRYRNPTAFGGHFIDVQYAILMSRFRFCWVFNCRTWKHKPHSACFTF